MKKSLVSIIVPVYKAERYLPRCIESILRQTYQNFELILVDDGSPDKCGEICDKYAQKDNRIKVIRKENGGVSSARNYGIDIAQGEFIYFVDSDDWLPKNSLQLHIDAMQKGDVQLTIGSTEHRALRITIGYFKSELINLQDPNLNLNGILLRGYAPWNTLFFKSIIVENNIRFSNNVSFGEDTLFVREYLKHVQCVYTMRDVGYYYNRLNEKAATTKKYKEIINWRLQLLKIAETLLEKSTASDARKQEAIEHQACVYFENCISTWMYLTKYDKKIVQEKIETCLKEFKPYLTFTVVNNKVWKERIKKVIFTNDVSLIYKTYKRFCKKQKIRYSLRAFFIKLMRPILERTRDSIK